MSKGGVVGRRILTDRFVSKGDWGRGEGLDLLPIFVEVFGQKLLDAVAGLVAADSEVSEVVDLAEANGGGVEYGVLELLGLFEILVWLDSVAVLVEPKLVSVISVVGIVGIVVVVNALHALRKGLALEIIIIVMDLIIVLELDVTGRTVTHGTRKVFVAGVLFLCALSSR